MRPRSARRFYYFGVFGALGFFAGQGVIVMWPEWSALTWWGLALACLPLLAIPTLWDNRHQLTPVLPTGVLLPAGRDYRAFRRDPRRGDVAACLILRAPSFGEAVRLFNDCRHSESGAISQDRLYGALIERMRTEGPAADVLAFLESEGVEGIPDDMVDAERERAFEWMIITFEEFVEQRRERE